MTTKALIKAKGCKAEAVYQMEILEHLGRNTEYVPNLLRVGEV